MDTALGKSLDLLLKLYVVDPMNINLSQTQSFLGLNWYYYQEHLRQ